jgi:hypothetical protein
MIEVSLIPKEYVDTCWEKVEPLLKKATDLSGDRYTTSHIYDMVMEDDYQLWIAYEDKYFHGAVVTNISNYPNRKILCMGFCGGEYFGAWKDQIIDILKRFARDMGCDSIEASGRPGWSKLLKDKGYSPKWVTFEIPI